MNCIWTGFIKDLICDKQFECENCEFDKVLRNLCSKKNEENLIPERKNNNPIEKLLKQIQSENFDENIIYLKNQLVLKNIFGNTYYLGINPVVMHLLDDYDYVNQPDNNEIKKGQIIFTLEGRWGKKHFFSPVDFSIIEKINFSRFKLQKWYAIILLEDVDENKNQVTYDDWNKSKTNTLSLLNDYPILNADIGLSMMDGGKKVKYLFQYFGEKKYLELLNRVFE